MSLFNTLDFWATRCGETENFGFSSMVVADINESGNELIIVGSFEGFLRIYQLNSEDTDYSFKPSHLLLEKQLSNPIIQVFAGKLVSGTRNLHIGVVLPASIEVYSFTLIVGSTDHGNQYDLRLIYKHALQHPNFLVLHGPFGGVEGRDFLCTVSIDGFMTFFEQETFVFKTQLPSFLLPSSIIYVKEVDMFVTLSADWCVESYRYQDMVNTAKKKVTANWTYNLGENIQGIQALKHRLRKETFLVVVSDHNLTCLGTNGFVKFTKRLQYSPMCFYCYLNESNNNLMTLIVSEGSVLYVYESKTLVWSAKLPFLPICICRANTTVNGSLVLLSDHGDLQCCYLGTKPSLFVAPPLENSVIHFKNTNTRLESLQNEIKNFQSENAVTVSSMTADHELSITVKLQYFDKTFNECQLNLDLVPSRPLSNIHVTFEATLPFEIQPKTFALPSLCELTELKSRIRINEHENIIPLSLNVKCIVCYSADDTVKVIQQTKSITPKFVLMPCSLIEDKCKFKICIETNKTPPPLTTIFQEFRDENWSESSCSEESASFCIRYNAEIKCLVTISKLKNGYDLHANFLPIIGCLLSLITLKFKNKKFNVDKNEKEISFLCQSLPKMELMDCIDRCVSIRNDIHNEKTFLEKLTSQFRLIQRRLLIKLKGKTFANISSVQALYQNTYEKIIDTIHAIETKQKDLISCSYEFQSVMDLLLDLLSTNRNISKETVDKFRNAVCMTGLSTNIELESIQVNLIHFLRTTIANTSNDENYIELQYIGADERVTDSSLFKNLINKAIEGISGQVSNIEGSQKNRLVAPLLEEDEFEMSSPQHIGEEQSESDELLSKNHLFRMTTTDISDEMLEEF